MSEEKTPVTGVEYPEIEIAGAKYILRLSRAALAYRVSKNGIELQKIMNNFSVLVDTLHVLMQPSFPGSAEQLAEFLIADDVLRGRATIAVLEAIKKVFPPTMAQAAAGTEARPN